MTGFLSFRDLDLLLAASPATLRRDLDRLEEQGKLKRVRGGAQLVEAEHISLSGVPFYENVGRNHPQKQAIGRAAAALCRQGEAVIIDGGSTTCRCARTSMAGLHVLTNSLHIVSALQHASRGRVYQFPPAQYSVNRTSFCPLMTTMACRASMPQSCSSVRLPSVHAVPCWPMCC